MEEKKFGHLKVAGVVLGAGMMLAGGVVALANNNEATEPTTEPETMAPEVAETGPSGLEEAFQAGIEIEFDDGRETVTFQFDEDDIPVEKYSIDGGLTWNEGTPSEELLNSETEIMWFSIADTEEGTVASFRETVTITEEDME